MGKSDDPFGLKKLTKNIDNDKNFNSKMQYGIKVTEYLAFAWFLMLFIIILVLNLTQTYPIFYGQFILTIPSAALHKVFPYVVNVWPIPLFYIIMIIPIWDGIFHLIVAISLSFKSSKKYIYNNWLDKRFFPIRWIQYSVSWAFMVIVLDTILHEGDPNFITSDFIDCMVINLLGLLQEYINRPILSKNIQLPKTLSEKFMSWFPYFLGCFLYVRILATRIDLLVANSLTFGDKIPWVAWVTLAFLLFVEIVFAVLQLLEQLQIIFFKNYYICHLAYTELDNLKIQKD
jgi:hypothetical protein